MCTFTKFATVSPKQILYSAQRVRAATDNIECVQRLILQSKTLFKVFFLVEGFEYNDRWQFSFHPPSCWVRSAFDVVAKGFAQSFLLGHRV